MLELRRPRRLQRLLERRQRRGEIIEQLLRHPPAPEQVLLLGRLGQHAARQREECLVGRARRRQPELRAELRVLPRRYPSDRGQIPEQLTLQCAPDLGALCGGPALRYHAGPLLRRQYLRARQQLLEPGERRRLGSPPLVPLRPMGPEEIPHPYGHLQPSPQYREHTSSFSFSCVPPPPFRSAERGLGGGDRDDRLIFR